MGTVEARAIAGPTRVYGVSVLARGSLTLLSKPDIQMIGPADNVEELGKKRPLRMNDTQRLVTGE